MTSTSSVKVLKRIKVNAANPFITIQHRVALFLSFQIDHLLSHCKPFAQHPNSAIPIYLQSKLFKHVEKLFSYLDSKMD